MAKIEGVQEIPAELLDVYRGNLLDEHPGAIVRKRYPYRIKRMQEGGPGVHAKQKENRERFKKGIGLFRKTTWPDRQRWYAAMPPWKSFLWYYNYFIMSSLSGNANLNQGGVGMIKSIQFKTIAMPAAAGEGQVAITAVDINKTVVMLFGASVIVHEEEQLSRTMVIYPYVSSIASELVKCKWSLATVIADNTKAANIGITVIEYI